MDAISSRRPGKALDVGMGQGRNAIGLAEKGWSVTGIDISEVGVSKAMQAARDRGLKITGIIEDADKFDFGKEQWDLIAFIYAGGREEVERVRAALRPGGIVVVEMFHREAAAKRPIGEGVVTKESDDWSKLYAGWKILKYEEPVDISDWGLEKIRLLRFVAQKPERATKN
jgi:SAM-dependent methyltransferase